MLSTHPYFLASTDSDSDEDLRKVEPVLLELLLCIEFLRTDMNEAILASSKTWSEKTLEMNKSLGQTLVSLGLGWTHRGNQRAKRRNLPSST